MSLLEWGVVALVAGLVVIVLQLTTIAGRLRQVVLYTRSLDAELFRLAQEQNPAYGVCSRCGERALVSYVVPKDSSLDNGKTDLFYCKPCWWMSSSVELSDEKKHYRDRMTERDRWAATVGPG